MSKAVWWISYKLVAGASVPDFLEASEKVNREVLSQQNGYISWQVLADGDTWVDLVTWETMEDAVNAETAGATNPNAQKFYSFIDPDSLTNQAFMVEKTY